MSLIGCGPYFQFKLATGHTSEHRYALAFTNAHALLHVHAFNYLYVLILTQKHGPCIDGALSLSASVFISTRWQIVCPKNYQRGSFLLE